MNGKEYFIFGENELDTQRKFEDDVNWIKSNIDPVNITYIKYHLRLVNLFEIITIRYFNYRRPDRKAYIYTNEQVISSVKDIFRVLIAGKEVLKEYESN